MWKDVYINSCHYMSNINSFGTITKKLYLWMWYIYCCFLNLFHTSQLLPNLFSWACTFQEITIHNFLYQVFHKILIKWYYLFCSYLLQYFPVTECMSSYHYVWTLWDWYLVYKTIIIIIGIWFIVSDSLEDAILGTLKLKFHLLFLPWLVGLSQVTSKEI